MYPQCPLPKHITVLYIVAVTSWAALFGNPGLLVQADVLVYSVAHKEVEMEFRDLQARFGESLPLDGLKGRVVPAAPLNACTTIVPPPKNENYTGKWIALIRRYDCDFDVKVRNAQNANYDCAIVYNANSSALESMTSLNPYDIHIPSVFIGEESGLIIMDNYIYNKSYYVVINDDSPFNLNMHLLLPFAIVVGLCFLIMLIFMVVKCVKDYRRQRRHRMPSSSLQRIGTVNFKKGYPFETCAICLDDFQEGEQLRVLPCAHAYHCKCIDPWLTKSKRVCPVCKRRVFAEDEQDLGDASDSSADETTPLVSGERAGPLTIDDRLLLLGFRPVGRSQQNVPQTQPNASSSSSSSSPEYSSLTPQCLINIVSSVVEELQEHYDHDHDHEPPEHHGPKEPEHQHGHEEPDHQEAGHQHDHQEADHHYDHQEVDHHYDNVDYGVHDNHTVDYGDYSINSAWDD